MTTILLTKTRPDGKVVTIEAGEWYGVQVTINGAVVAKDYAPQPIRRRHASLPADVTAQIGGKAYLVGAEGEAVLAAWEAVEIARRTRLNEIVPGLDILRDARADRDRYDDAFAAMMDDEFNDGARPPKAPSTDPDALAARYPLAVLYLRAEAYADASNDRKVAAGKRAIEILRAGGDAAEAAATLDNWLPESAMYD